MDESLALQASVVDPADHEALERSIIVDCRYVLTDPEAGRALFDAGHIPGACYLDLARDLSGPVRVDGGRRPGGRHPLPEPQRFAETLAGLGIHRGSEVIAYDDSGFAYGARLWWMMRSLGYRPPRLLDGGYAAWLALGGEPERGMAEPDPCEAPEVGHWTGFCDIEGVRKAQSGGALLIDSREPRRYEGLEEPMDPVAGHIPGALNRPWQAVTSRAGNLHDDERLHAHWGDALAAESLVVYCGSGVTACVNLFSLARLGRNDPLLYPGGWSDWCSYL